MTPSPHTSHSTVFIVDDDTSIRNGLARLIRSEGMEVELFESAQQFLKRDTPGGPSCLVLDVQMPGLNGLELQQEIIAQGTTTPIIFITGHGDIPMSVKAMKAGAVDFLSKPFLDDELLKAIETALKEDCRLRCAQAEAHDIQQRLDCLTPREREVHDLVITGMLNKQIAGKLGAAEKTIKVHRGRVMQKMKVFSVAELVHLTERLNVIYPPPSADL